MTTKAEKVRTILIRDLGNKSEGQILNAVSKTTGLSSGLAKVYIRNNAAKLKGKRVSKKKGTSKRAAAAKKKTRPSK